MNFQDTLKATFREQELAHRMRLRQQLLAQVALLDGDESEWDAETRAAIIRIRVSAEVETAYRMNAIWSRLPFWKRLRAAFQRHPFMTL